MTRARSDAGGEHGGAALGDGTRRFDGWDECFRPDLWRGAFEATGVDPAWYAHRQRGRDEMFPWDHLQGGAPRDYLRRQYDDVATHLKPETIGGVRDAGQPGAEESAGDGGAPGFGGDKSPPRSGVIPARVG